MKNLPQYLQILIHQKMDAKGWFANRTVKSIRGGGLLVVRGDDGSRLLPTPTDAEIAPYSGGSIACYRQP